MQNTNNRQPQVKNTLTITVAYVLHIARLVSALFATEIHLTRANSCLCEAFRLVSNGADKMKLGMSLGTTKSNCRLQKLHLGCMLSAIKVK